LLMDSISIRGIVGKKYQYTIGRNKEQDNDIK
jgi:hypothetical protein